ncbi:MAG: zinc finger domain-containing protein [Nanoarchaeota archaeon]
MADKMCISCKKTVVNDAGSIMFSCPQCSHYEIVRCSVCRKTGTKYTCPACRFAGPN